MYRFSLLFLLVSLFACSSLDVNNEYSSNEETLSDFFESQGVVSFLHNDKCLSKDVVIYNADGTEYCRLNFYENKFYYEDAVILFENPNNLRDLEMFSPMELYPNYSILRFEYESSLDNKYNVYVDKEKTILKHIVIDDSNCFEVKTWRDYFLGSWVGNDFNKNPMRESNNDDSKQVNTKLNYDDYFFAITEIKGEWVKIECVGACGFECDLEISGWIRWKRDNTKLISLPSAC